MKSYPETWNDKRKLVIGEMNTVLLPDSIYGHEARLAFITENYAVVIANHKLWPYKIRTDINGKKYIMFKKQPLILS